MVKPEKKWRPGDNLISFIKREKVRGTLQQAAHERQVTRDMKAKKKGK